MDEEKNPVDVLNEILSRGRTAQPAPDPPKAGPPPEPPPSGGPALQAAFREEAPRRGSSPLPWMAARVCALLAAVCAVQLAGVSRRLDGLEQAVDARQELLEQIEALESENESLAGENTRLDGLAGQTSQEAKGLADALDDADHRLNILSAQRRSLLYLWYLQQFMDAGDYPMAANVVVYSASFYYYDWINNSIKINPALVEQYDRYAQELTDRGYIQVLHQVNASPDVSFTGRWDPSQNVDAAKLAILWCVLDYHFVRENGQAAAQYLANTVLAFPGTDLKQAGSFALGQLRTAKDGLVESSWLTVDEDGILHEGLGPNGVKNDILYDLPFELPGQMTILYG